jgi:hypothetical protein
MAWLRHPPATRPAARPDPRFREAQARRLPSCHYTLR